MGMKINNGNEVTPSINKNKSKARLPREFQRVLEQSIGDKQQDVKISSHAKMRMVERNINLDKSDMQVISKAIEELNNKGARESLMLYKDMAFIASVDNRTIITAMGDKEVDIVTNIDSAVIIK